MNFVCVLKTGGIYTAAHVERLRAMLWHPVTCLTDDPEVTGPTIPLRHNWPGWWSKLELFEHDLGHVCYLDLDVTVQHLDWLGKLNPATFYGMADAYQPGGCPFNSSVMVWNGKRPDLLSGLTSQDMQHPGGDQQWIWRKLAGNFKLLTIPDVASYKAHGKKPEFGVVVYHGKPKPWDIAEFEHELLDSYPKYGHSNHGARAVRIIQKWNPASILDVGCGWNEFAVQTRMALPAARVIGVDPACPGADVSAEAVSLPFADKEFTVVTSFDMLEHLPECEVEAALAEMARVSTAFIFSISYVPSVNKWQGKTLHPTVKPECWWIEKIMKAGGMHIDKNGRFLTGHWQPVIWRPKSTDTVVVVGNGPSALRAYYGQIIDSHDHVVRFNNYKVAGYEIQVGTRTSLWSSVGIARSQFDPASIPLHSLLIDGESAKHEQAEAMPCERLPRWFYNQVRKELQERSAWRSGFAPAREKLLATSGMLVVAWLLRVKNIQQITLVGFDHFSKVRSGQHHYWLPTVFKKPPEHDGEAEADMFADLQAAGRVTYL